ncbi:hypothetical protein G5V59_24485 [Nocardioides sp. W3-2-3]|uniref:MCE family protein n=1 Tax=Nocardioides convexus TaxID=2712224 RepID=UPI0024182CD5|nr:MCE family protein [Nocardioides convexus]NHA01789.1 hypothetical protein [Nocardioides convexus]
MVRDGDAFLGRWAALHPQVRRDLDLLAQDSDLVADVEPPLVAALRDSRPLARTLVAQRQATTTLLQGVSRLLDGKDGVTTFLRAHGGETARLLNASAANLEVFAQRYPAFASLLRKVPQAAPQRRRGGQERPDPDGGRARAAGSSTRTTRAIPPTARPTAA